MLGLGVLCALLALLEHSWDALRPVLGGLEALLGRFWAILGHSWGLLGRSWAPRGRILARLGGILGDISQKGRGESGVWRHLGIQNGGQNQ